MANEIVVRGGIAAVSAIVTGLTALGSHVIGVKSQEKIVKKKLAKLGESKIAAKAAELEVEELSEEMFETYKEELMITPEEAAKITKAGNKKVIGGTVVATTIAGGATAFGGYLLGNAIMNASAESADSSAPEDAALIGGYLAPVIR